LSRSRPSSGLGTRRRRLLRRVTDRHADPAFGITRAGSSTPLANPSQCFGAITRTPGRRFSQAPHHENELLLVITTSAFASSCRSTTADYASSGRCSGRPAPRGRRRGRQTRRQLIAITIRDRFQGVHEVGRREGQAPRLVKEVGTANVHADIRLVVRKHLPEHGLMLGANRKKAPNLVGVVGEPVLGLEIAPYSRPSAIELRCRRGCHLARKGPRRV